LALLVIPVLVMEERATTPQLREAAAAINWIIWKQTQNPETRQILDRLESIERKLESLQCN
jgi:hypothetical protein